jgi:hypothetical protein
MSSEALDSRIRHLVRAVRNENGLLDRKIIRLQEKLDEISKLFPTPIDSTGPNYTGQPLGRPHLGSAGMTPKQAYGFRIQQEMNELQAELDENYQALKSLDKGLLPSSGSRRWLARPGYNDLYCECVNKCLCDFGNVLGRLYTEVVDDEEVIEV